MFESIKRFFKNKKRNYEGPSERNVPDFSRIGVELFNNYDKIQSSLEQTDEDYVKNSVKRYYEDLSKGVNMSKFLVVLDTQNRPEVQDKGLKGGLKNFYIVNAANKKQAMEMVLSTFAHRPNILKQLQYSFTVTDLNDIAKTVTGQHPVWSYIPFNKNHRAPGQKSTPPTQTLNPNDSDEVIPMREPPRIITPPEQDNTDKIRTAPSAPAMDMNNPMAAMFGMMAQAMGNPEMMENFQKMFNNPQQSAQQSQENPPEPVIKKVDPTTDPELQQRMSENLQAQGARHISHTGVGDAVVSVEHGGMDDMLNEAEAQAKAEIEAFKSLPKNQQADVGSLVVKNDVSVKDMEEFRKIQKRTDRNVE